MKVYLVKYRYADCDDVSITIDRVFSSEEKAKRYIETTYKSHVYNFEYDIWEQERAHSITQVWYEEWEVE